MELNYIKDNYGKIKAKEIAEHLNISIHRVYNIARKYKLGNELNSIFNLNETQKQILISGKIGDGSFKKNGSNYYYRECHAITEREYLLWKYEQLYETTTKRIYNIKAREHNHNNQVLFQTRNSPSFEKYATMSKLEGIMKLDELGLILLCLDDGWCKRYTHSFGYYISIASFNSDEIKTLIFKFDEIMSIKCKYIPSSGGTISIQYRESPKLLEGILKYLPKDMDIIQGKFREFVK